MEVMGKMSDFVSDFHCFVSKTERLRLGEMSGVNVSNKRFEIYDILPDLGTRVPQRHGALEWGRNVDNFACRPTRVVVRANSFK